MQLTFENIQKTAEKIAQEYRKKHKVPELPSIKQLAPYHKIINTEFKELSEEIKRYVSQFEQEGYHGYEHLENIAALAGFIAEDECIFRKLPQNKTREIVNNAILAGLMHDIERHQGGPVHMSEGANTAEILLKKYNLFDENIVLAISIHEKLEYKIENNNELEVIYGAIYDADHFMYGYERETTFWYKEKQKGATPKEAIKAYDWLYAYENSWKTRYGKNIGPELIRFGLWISEGVGKCFTINE